MEPHGNDVSVSVHCAQSAVLVGSNTVVSLSLMYSMPCDSAASAACCTRRARTSAAEARCSKRPTFTANSASNEASRTSTRAMISVVPRCPCGIICFLRSIRFMANPQTVPSAGLYCTGTYVDGLGIGTCDRIESRFVTQFAGGQLPLDRQIYFVTDFLGSGCAHARWTTERQTGDFDLWRIKRRAGGIGICARPLRRVGGAVNLHARTIEADHSVIVHRIGR